MEAQNFSTSSPGPPMKKVDVSMIKDVWGTCPTSRPLTVNSTFKRARLESIRTDFYITHCVMGLSISPSLGAQVRVVPLDIASVQCPIGASKGDDTPWLSSRGFWDRWSREVKTNSLIRKLVRLLKSSPKGRQALLFQAPWRRSESPTKT